MSRLLPPTQELERPTAIHLLAGGQSRRMGQNKADLMLGPLPLAQWSLRSAESLNQGEVTMVQEDRRSGQGPLAGMETAMLATPARIHLFLTCDMPFVSSRTMGDLMSVSSQHQRIACMQSRGYLGFPMAVPHSTLSRIGDLLDARQRRVQSLLSGPSTLCFAWQEEDAAEAWNINTPEDLAIARECIERDGWVAPLIDRQKPLSCVQGNLS